MTKWIGDHPAVGKTRRNMGRIERWVVKQERILVRNENQMHAVVAIAQKYPNFSAIVQIIGPRWRRFSIERVAHYFDINWKGQS